MQTRALLLVPTLAIPLCLIERGEPTRAAPDAEKRVVGHVNRVGCTQHPNASCPRACFDERSSMLVRAANREVFLLWGIDEPTRASILEHAGQAIAIAGDFAWQGSLRTLAVKSVAPADEEAYEEARKADAEYEMRAYVMVLIKPGPKSKEFDDDARAEIMKGHFAHIGRQAAAGRLMLAGPFAAQKPEHKYSGIYVYDVPSMEAARELNAKDPSIESGYFATELLTWYGPKSLGY